MTGPAVRWVRADEALWRAGLDRAVLLAPGDDEPVELSASAALVWGLLAEPVTPDAAAALIAEACELAPDRVAADIAPLLAELEARGAVRRVP